MAGVSVRKSADTTLPRELSSQVLADIASLVADSPDFKRRYLHEQFLSKYISAETDPAEVRRRRAIDKWLTTEGRNAMTNVRLRSATSGDFFFYEGVSYRKLTERVKVVVRSVIGESPSEHWGYCSFSGGATTSRRRSEGHPAFKYLTQADVTRGAISQFWRTIAGTAWQNHIDRCGLDIRYVPGNVLFTVPKSTTIDRVCCKEPDLNIYLQKGLGKQVRLALKRVGINLDDQGPNGELARIGSITGNYATIDLSSASDSMSAALVEALVPSDWLYAFSQVRSPTTSIDGELKSLEMFSSMGNGFTFELESLLFYAIAKAVAYLTGTRGRLLVYGDDIVCPSEMSEALIRALAYYGFKTNLTKTFTDGPFRESCGTHWYSGEDVKPFYVRKPIERLSDLILLLNGLARWAAIPLGTIRVGRGPELPVLALPPDVLKIWSAYREYIPKALWGGQDFSVRTSLVTGHRPRKELSLVTTALKLPGDGGYLLWLQQAAAREVHVDLDEIVAQAPSTEYRLRRNQQVERDDLPIFWESVRTAPE